jgi:tetratricopeptide (TPR) repeat protein
MSKIRNLLAFTSTALLLAASAVCTMSQIRTGAAAAQAAGLKIATEPGAVVWVDGVRYGTTSTSGSLSIRSIPAGPHSIRVRLDGYKEKQQSITAAQRGTINIPLLKTDDPAELAFQEAERLAGSDREKSAETYRRAIKLRPGYAEAYVALARVLSDAGDLEAAKQAINAARKLKPGFAEASAVEGRIYKDNGDEAKAIASFKRAITEGKGFQPEAYAGLGLLYKEKAEGEGGSGDFDSETESYDEAARNLKIALKQLSGAPDALVIYQLLGLIYERQKKADEAIATYEEFLRLFPDATEATAVRSFIVQLKKDRRP